MVLTEVTMCYQKYVRPLDDESEVTTLLLAPLLDTFPETSIARENRPSQKEVVSHPPNLRVYVRFREGTTNPVSPVVPVFQNAWLPIRRGAQGIQ